VYMFLLMPRRSPISTLFPYTTLFRSYCDQRENRKILASYVKGKKVLDCFSYSGGFTLNSFLQGAREVVSVDSSALAIETLKKNRSEEHTSELQSRENLVCRLLLEKKK